MVDKVLLKVTEAIKALSKTLNEEMQRLSNKVEELEKCVRNNSRNIASISTQKTSRETNLDAEETIEFSPVPSPTPGTKWNTDHEMLDAENNAQPITNYNIINAKSDRESERKRIDDRPKTSKLQSSPIDSAKMKRAVCHTF